ncbi:hypothetical protein AWN76_013260 [Rhodothermaceae bacterium RA]|nr:hypothetical protein AWN76_013260 [Rhodothermaceae bacterium RA]
MIVLGSGVIGLTAAIRLQEAGFAPRLLTRDRPEATTSAVAAAVWYPYRAYPAHRVLPWSRRTLEVCYDLAADPTSGVSLIPFVDLFDRPTPPPAWRTAVRAFRRARPDERPAGYVDGFVAEVPLIETPVHLPYLVARFEAGGGTIEVVPGGVTDLAALAASAGLVVNCTGLGARRLVPDPSLYPIRGQVVRVTNPGLTHALADDTGPLAISYVIPRRGDVILGGTAQDGVWDRTPDPETTREILRKARLLEPRLADAAVLEARVGLRPGRPTVRLEAERLPGGGTVIHNYGHGGAGFTLAWGCADEVVALVRAHHARPA